ncbi:hypothetical protein sscle_02g013470 [Sclerotinia sclerotiorum 1980 UF-70]|uniref:Uncharacterized protein n=1 Tax=Sclerotinia sclerotiorum (strain ATCC 18683 / 1980 / Ss-1) TaxID=665079 RepID=A0A1D9PV53_SCLS1|nr:hypothetical protein sscle_02g013470 [Sclerotinia sclerotiorum 1980 UF-70]
MSNSPSKVIKNSSLASVTSSPNTPEPTPELVPITESNDFPEQVVSSGAQTSSVNSVLISTKASFIEKPATMPTSSVISEFPSNELTQEFPEKLTSSAVTKNTTRSLSRSASSHVASGSGSGNQSPPHRSPSHLLKQTSSTPGIPTKCIISSIEPENTPPFEPSSQTISARSLTHSVESEITPSPSDSLASETITPTSAETFDPSETTDPSEATAPQEISQSGTRESNLTDTAFAPPNSSPSAASSTSSQVCLITTGENCST